MKKFFISLCLALTCASSYAVPALPRWKTVTQPDGTVLQVKLVGDELLHYYVTADNLPLVENDGAFYYAHINDGRLRASDILAHETPLRTSEEVAQVADFQLKQTAVRQARAKAREALPTRVGEATGSYTGSKKGLVILVQFSDLDFAIEDAQTAFNRQANEEGYTDNGAVGSVHDYFYDQSYGKFDLTFDVVGPYTAPKNVKYYGTNSNGSDQWSRIVELVKFACNSANDEVNFADYDWDGDGEVDQVFIIYAGYAESSGAESWRIWPHESQLYYNAFYVDGVRVNTYACSAELTGTEGTDMDGIGTMCHEFCHCLGLPDFYDTTDNSSGTTGNYGMGYFSLMCWGPYNGDGKIPASFTGYERNFCGWLDYRELTAPCKVSALKPIADGGDVYRITNPANENEYYLLENRNGNVGWDRGFYTNNSGQIVNGMMVTHVTYVKNRWTSNTVNTTGKGYQCMTILHADNSDATTMEYEGVTYLDGNEIFNDLYPYRVSIAKNVNSISDTSTPVDTLNTPNTDGQYLMHTNVSAITRKSRNVSFKFEGGNDEWEDVAAGIQTASISAADDADDRIYTLDGRLAGRNLQELPKGVYVTRGKKIVK